MQGTRGLVWQGDACAPRARGPWLWRVCTCVCVIVPECTRMFAQRLCVEWMWCLGCACGPVCACLLRGARGCQGVHTCVFSRSGGGAHMCVWLSQSLRGGGRPCTPMVQALLSPRAPQLLCPLLELAGSSLGGCAGVPRAPCCLWCRGAIKVQSWRHAGHPPPPRVPHLIGDRPPRGATEVPTRAGARGSERALPHRSGLGGCPHMRLHVHFSGVSGGADGNMATGERPPHGGGAGCPWAPRPCSLTWPS